MGKPLKNKNALSLDLGASYRRPVKRERRVMEGPLDPPLSATSWAQLPVLSIVFDFLTDTRDLAVAACVCTRWAAEASRDYRWQRAWAARVSDHCLWRWAKAQGGFREQLKANALVRKGT